MKKGPVLAVFLERWFPLSNIALGFLLYMVGLTIAWVNRHTSLFLEVWYIPLAIVGIAWVTSAFCWALRALPTTLNEIRISLDVSDEYYETMIQRHLQVLYNDKKTLIISMPGMLMVFLYLILVFYRKISLPYVIIPEIVFKNPIYFVYGGIIGLFGVYLVSAGVYYLFQHTLFVHKISQLPIRINVLEVERRPKLHDLARFSIVISFSWSVGTSLSILATITYLNVFTVGFTLFASVVALLTFFIPQFSLSKSIIKAKRKLLINLANKFVTKFDLLPRNAIEVLVYCALFNEVERIKEWPFNVRTSTQLVMSTLLPILTVFLKLYLPTLPS